MLSLMRKYAKSWIVKIILGIIVIAFALSWGVTSQYLKSSNIIAKVNNELITTNQLQEEIISLEKNSNLLYIPQLGYVKQLKTIKEQAIIRLVDQLLLYQFAQKKGFLVTNAELKANITLNPFFQRSGNFYFNQYQWALGTNNFSPEIYENKLKMILVQERLFASLIDSVKIAPLELEKIFTLYFSQIQGGYLLFNPEDYLAKIIPTQEEVNDYYYKNSIAYLQPERISIAYLIFSSDTYRNEISLNEDKVAEIYERERNHYSSPEIIKVRHILIETNPGVSTEEEIVAKTKADNILIWYKNHEEEFVKKAQEFIFSYDKDRQSINLDNTTKLLKEAAFSLLPGQMNLKRTNQGWHIVKVEERTSANIVAIEEISQQIKQKIIGEIARLRAKATAEWIYSQVIDGVDLTLLAKKLKIPLQQAFLINTQDNLPSILGVNGLLDIIKGVPIGQIAQPISYNDGTLLVHIKERTPEYLLTLDEVKSDIIYSIKVAKANYLAYQSAKFLASQLIEENDRINILLANTRVQYTNWLTMNNKKVENLLSPLDFVEVLLSSLNNRFILTSPIVTANGFIIAAIAKQRKVHLQNHQNQEEQLYYKLLIQKRQKKCQDFIQDLRSKAEIKMMIDF